MKDYGYNLRVRSILLLTFRSLPMLWIHRINIQNYWNCPCLLYTNTSMTTWNSLVAWRWPGSQYFVPTCLCRWWQFPYITSVKYCKFHLWKSFNFRYSEDHNNSSLEHVSLMMTIIWWYIIIPYMVIYHNTILSSFSWYRPALLLTFPDDSNGPPTLEYLLGVATVKHYRSWSLSHCS